MPFVLIAPVLVLVATLAVPFVYRSVWPGGVARRGPYFAVTVTLAIIIAAIAIVWFAQALIGIGIARASPATVAASARTESLLRIRLIIAGTGAVVAQYIVCYLTQEFLRR